MVCKFKILPNHQKVPPKIDIMTPDFALVIDRANSSSQNANVILAAPYHRVELYTYIFSSCFQI